MASKKKANMNNSKTRKKLVKLTSKINFNIKLFPDKTLNLMILFTIKC